MAGTQGHTFRVKAGGRAWWPEARFPNVTPPLLPSFRSSVLTQWTNGRFIRHHCSSPNPRWKERKKQEVQGGLRGNL